MDKLYRDIKNWARQTFGGSREPEEILTKLHEEVGELTERVRIYGEWTTQENRYALREEIADVTIMLFHLAQRFGICFDDYTDGIRIKHEMNKKRKWVEMPDGTFKHLPDGTKITYK